VIDILPFISIPESELHFSASRSGGPGGQNVNKVSSRVTIMFNVEQSSALSEDQKHAIMRKLASRINKDGVLRVVSQRTRSQDLNRTDAIGRFTVLIRQALTPEVPRVKTRIPGAAHQRRIEQKRKKGSMKRERSQRGWE